eukprot:1044650-Amphidinium_carterae.1
MRAARSDTGWLWHRNLPWSKHRKGTLLIVPKSKTRLLDRPQSKAMLRSIWVGEFKELLELCEPEHGLKKPFGLSSSIPVISRHCEPMFRVMSKRFALHSTKRCDLFMRKIPEPFRGVPKCEVPVKSSGPHFHEEAQNVLSMT